MSNKVLKSDAGQSHHDQAGTPGKGPWVLYGGPWPFTQSKVSDRPKDAKQRCALVANADHSVIAKSSNCIALP